MDPCLSRSYSHYVWPRLLGGVGVTQILRLGQFGGPTDGCTLHFGVTSFWQSARFISIRVYVRG